MARIYLFPAPAKASISVLINGDNTKWMQLLIKSLLVVSVGWYILKGPPLFYIFYIFRDEISNLVSIPNRRIGHSTVSFVKPLSYHFAVVSISRIECCPQTIPKQILFSNTYQKKNVISFCYSACWSKFGNHYIIVKLPICQFQYALLVISNFLTIQSVLLPVFKNKHLLIIFFSEYSAFLHSILSLWPDFPLKNEKCNVPLYKRTTCIHRRFRYSLNFEMQQRLTEIGLYMSSWLLIRFSIQSKSVHLTASTSSFLFICHTLMVMCGRTCACVLCVFLLRVRVRV